MKIRIKEYILHELLNDAGEAELSFDEEILTDGRVDSLGVMRLVAFLESETGLSIPPEDLVLENFASIDAIGSYLENRKL